MRLMPESNDGKIQFCQSHLGPWLENAQMLGISEDEVLALAEKVDSARTARLEQAQAMSIARSTTATMNRAIDEMAQAAATIILKVRGKAREAGSGIYPLARIPAPEKGSPIEAPGTPTHFRKTLSGGGALILTWKCKNPRGSVGTLYKIDRQIGVAGEFEFLGIVGECKFTDDTIPAGASRIIYRIQAVRTTAVGPAAEFIVSFGGVRRVTPLQVAA